MSPTFVSLFAGVGGFDLGLERAGFTCVGQVEIDEFCRKVLTVRWPEVPKHDDVRTATEWWHSEQRPRVDVVTGGFPCQDVSVAGKRAGLSGGRTGLFFDAADFIAAVRPAFVLMENVPGLLTSNQGRDFGVVLDTLVESGYPYVEWRVLDSQYFGVPQRRRRVFIVASARDPRGGSVLSEPASCGRDPASGDEEGPQAATSAGVGAEGGGGDAIASGRLVGALQAQGETGGFRFDADGAGAGHIFPTFAGFPDPAGALTRRYINGINSTVDDGAIIYHRGVERAAGVGDEGAEHTDGEGDGRG